MKMVRSTDDLLDDMDIVYAYDSLINRVVVCAVRDGWATSLVTGHRFKYKGNNNQNDKTNINRRNSR